MFVRLEITAPGQPRRDQRVSGPTIVVGRDPSSQLSFDGKTHDAVSWRHARIELADSGASISDLGSSNGTFLNGSQVAGVQPLRVGDIIALGHTGPKLRIVELSTAAPPTNPTTRLEKMLPNGMLTPPVGTKPLAVSSDSLPVRTPKRRRVSIAGVALSILALAAVVVAGVMILNGQKKSSITHEPAVSTTDEPPAKPKELETNVSAKIALPKSEEKSNEPTLQPRPTPPVKVDPPPPPTTFTGEQIYKRTLRSVGWINSTKERLPSVVASATGSLVDEKERLFLTANHVIEGMTDHKIYFPDYDADGSAIADRRHYLRDGKPVLADVILSEPSRDLAILRLRESPKDVLPLAVAKKGVGVAHRVFTVGNPAASPSLWVYTEGTVRQLGKRRLQLDNRRTLDAWVIEAQFPINPGDSGGPVVNDANELVGVNCAKSDTAQLLSTLIDVREVRELLDRARPSSPEKTP